MDVTALFQQDALFPGTSSTMMQAVAAGAFNGAVVTIQTAYWPTTVPDWSSQAAYFPGQVVAHSGQWWIALLPSFDVAPSSSSYWQLVCAVPSYAAAPWPSDCIVGVMTLNVGQIGNVKKTGRSKVAFEVFDLTYLLNRPVPPWQIQSQCYRALFDAGCALLSANWTSAPVALAAGSTQAVLNLDVLPRVNGHPYAKGDLILVSSMVYMCSSPGNSAGSPPAFNGARYAVTTDGGAQFTSMNGAYPLGCLTFATGDNAGFGGSVKDFAVAGSSVQLTLARPLMFAVGTGDTVTLAPGCDKTAATCSLYGNLSHFTGKPLVPNPEIAQ